MSETEYLIISDPEGCGSKVYGRQNQSQQLCQDTTFVALNDWISKTGKTRKIVFCGDYFDNGPVENIERFIKTIMRLDKKHNETGEKQIIILLGNRDLNKLRLAKEIGVFNPQDNNLEEPILNGIEDIGNINDIYQPVEDTSERSNDYIRYKRNDFGNPRQEPTSPTLFQFFKQTMGLNFNVDDSEYQMKLVKFFKDFWSKENIWGNDGESENVYPFSMMDFFGKCDIIHIENGIFFAHGGIDLEYFNKGLLDKTELKDLPKYFKDKLTKALVHVGILSTTPTPSSKLEDITKHFNLSVGQNLLKPMSSKEETEHLADGIITYYDYKLQNMKYNDDTLTENEKAYYFLLNLSFYQAYSPVMCSGGINGDCEENKAMDNKLIDFYINKTINTLVLGHKPICFPIPLGFYDGTGEKKIYTFANDLMGYRNLIQPTGKLDVIPLGILKKNTKEDWNQPPKFLVSYLVKDTINNEYKILKYKETIKGQRSKLPQTQDLQKIVELINKGHILHSEDIKSEGKYKPRSTAKILAAYKSVERLKPDAKGGGLQIRRKSRKSKKSRRIRRNSRRNRIKKRNSRRNRIKKRNIRKTKKNRRKSKRF